MTTVDVSAIRHQVVKLAAEAVVNLETIDKVADIIKIIRHDQQSLRQALTLILDHLDQIAPQTT